MTIQQTITQLSNQCVLCGLCIPHCSTYQIFRTENESPRGRIALYKALAEAQIEADEQILTSLDHCLTCRACEKVCPSQVDYATINQLGRELLASHSPKTGQIKQKIAEKLLVTPSLHPLLKLSSKTLAPFQALLEKTSSKSSILGSVTRLSHEIAHEAAINTPLKEFYPAHHSTGEQVILFKGCSSDLFEQQTLLATIKLLNACQFDVVIPEKQQCCGAINSRHGDTQGITKQAEENIKKFKPLLKNSKAILSITNSCTGQLKEYDKLLSHSDNSAYFFEDSANFSLKVTDIISFLARELENNEESSNGNIHFTALTKEQYKIGVHIPCSLKNVLKQERYLFDLLRNIPNIELITINEQYCCGAAGSYMLQYPDIAKQLIDDKMSVVIENDFQTIVSSNIGCSLHFKDALSRHEQAVGRKIEVIHPIQLLARQLV